MTDTPDAPDHAAPDVEADARNRALRTFVQGLALDLLLAVALTVGEAVEATSVDWRLLGLAVVKTAVTTAASYVARKLAPPAVV